ncbi:DUF3881 family protein [Fusibacillus kribbianus]|uniref:DUF3881 family protein n=1 Tax=Fusibacillus kribbianus TaxID=3044208 RepID=A0AAP4BBC4_9FIRM|nr:DUF3881 family protein [Ruminococcus sp. YH-rum2234]MDI9242717.1 DUF3881 family protein [Ruminococcus sp. YH-rum2234]
MHKFLRAVGFSEYTKKKEIRELLSRIQDHHDELQVIQVPGDGTRAQLYTEVGNGIGISVYGELNEQDELEREYYFPFLRSTCISTQAPCQIQRHAEKESYAGICEEYRVGVSLIFYLQNGGEYMKRLQDSFRSTQISSVMLSALSVFGKILLPVQKTETQKERIKVAAANRTSLLEAARRGDTDAMDSLAMEDMDLYASISGRVREEDVYSIVDSCFMPFGVECDQYSLLGEILEVEKVTNRWTNEEIYVLMVECSDLMLQIGINKKDLLGEPVVGRRFKGPVWVQGQVNFLE